MVASDSLQWATAMGEITALLLFLVGDMEQARKSPFNNEHEEMVSKCEQDELGPDALLSLHWH